jgi:hypothetical protein
MQVHILFYTIIFLYKSSKHTKSMFMSYQLRTTALEEPTAFTFGAQKLTEHRESLMDVKGR